MLCKNLRNSLSCLQKTSSLIVTLDTNSASIFLYFHSPFPVYICAQERGAKLMAYLLLEFSINMQIYSTSCGKAICAPHKQHSELPKRGSFQREIAFSLPVHLYGTGKTVKKTIAVRMKIDDIFYEKFSHRGKEADNSKCMFVL